MKRILIFIPVLLVILLLSCEKDNNAIALSKRLKLDDIYMTEDGIVLNWNKITRYDVQQYYIFRYDTIPGTMDYQCNSYIYNGQIIDYCGYDYTNRVEIINNSDETTFIDNSFPIAKQLYYRIAAVCPDTMIISNSRVIDIDGYYMIIDFNPSYMNFFPETKQFIACSYNKYYLYDIKTQNLLDIYIPENNYYNSINAFNYKGSICLMTSNMLYKFEKNTLNPMINKELYNYANSFTTDYSNYIYIDNSSNISTYDLGTLDLVTNKYISENADFLFYRNGYLYVFSNWGNALKYEINTDGTIGDNVVSKYLSISFNSLKIFPDKTYFITSDGNILDSLFNNKGSLNNQNYYGFKEFAFDNSGKYIFTLLNNDVTHKIYIYDRNTRQIIKNINTLGIPKNIFFAEDAIMVHTYKDSYSNEKSAIERFLLSDYDL